MAKKEDAETGNNANDGLESDNESDDDLFPITTKKCMRKKKPRQRKRSASLPFIENHTGLYKGLVTAKGLQLVKAKDNRQTTWSGIEEEDEPEFEDGLTDMNRTLGEQGTTRRSSSMPEFYHFSQRRKDEPSKRFATKSGGSIPERNKLLANEADLEQKEEESFKLPVISSSMSSKSTQGPSKEIEALSQTTENMKIQRKTYLPRINSNNGSIFMKSR